MESEITIRPCAEGDAAAFRELRLEGLRLHPLAFGADYAHDEQKPLSDWAQRLSQNIANPDQIIHFAEVGGQLIGVTGIYRIGSTKMRHGATIWGVYVREGWRGRGVIDRLLAATLDWARDQGVRVAKLAVTTTNVAAQRAYLRNGFAVYGVEPEVIAWDGAYHDELLMARRV
ncbi:MAG TPA: GNAT family N-acetyltransferase [Herpetosiphonaceae bacterium]